MDLRGAVRAASSRAEPIEGGDGEEGTEVRPPPPHPVSPEHLSQCSSMHTSGRVCRGKGWLFLVTKLRSRSRRGSRRRPRRRFNPAVFIIALILILGAVFVVQSGEDLDSLVASLIASYSF